MSPINRRPACLTSGVQSRVLSPGCVTGLLNHQSSLCVGEEHRSALFSIRVRFVCPQSVPIFAPPAQGALGSRFSSAETVTVTSRLSPPEIVPARDPLQLLVIVPSVTRVVVTRVVVTRVVVTRVVTRDVEDGFPGGSFVLGGGGPAFAGVRLSAFPPSMFDFEHQLDACFCSCAGDADVAVKRDCESNRDFIKLCILAERVDRLRTNDPNCPRRASICSVNLSTGVLLKSVRTLCSVPCCASSPSVGR